MQFFTGYKIHYGFDIKKAGRKMVQGRKSLKSQENHRFSASRGPGPTRTGPSASFKTPQAGAVNIECDGGKVKSTIVVLYSRSIVTCVMYACDTKSILRLTQRLGDLGYFESEKMRQNGQFSLAIDKSQWHKQGCKSFI